MRSARNEPRTFENFLVPNLGTVVIWECEFRPQDHRVASPLLHFLEVVVRVIARSTLKTFVESLQGSKDHTAVKGAVESWFHEAHRAVWKSPADVLRSYGHASIVGTDRVVFNIKGNDYRLVVSINYARQIVFIKWIGTHADYDNINVKTVQYGN